MALAPQFAVCRIGSPAAKHTLELYLDLICPFSKKQVKGVRDNLIPLIESNAEVGKSLSIVIRQTPQPWHSSSTLVHEAALAVAKVSGYDAAKYQGFFFKLIDGQEAFYDVPCSNETPNQTRARLADLAAEFVPRDEYLKVAGLTGESPNGGTFVTSDLKLAIKYGRQNGVHVTPTVALDGIIDPSISSSFSKDDWLKYLREKVGVEV